jgi:PAS domain S-box-containing protein
VGEFASTTAQRLDNLPNAARLLVQQVHLEHALAESEARLAGIIGTAMDAVLTVELDQRITLFNRAAERMFRCPASSALAAPITRFLPGGLPVASDATLHFDSEATAAMDREGIKIELRGLRANGDEFPVEASISPVSVGDRRFFTFILRDLTNRNRNEAALRESEERFRSAFDDTNVAMSLTDIENRFVRVNSAFAQLLGYSEAELLQLSMPDLTHPDDLRESYARRELLLADNERYFQMEKRFLRKDGAVLWGLINVSLIRDASGKPLMYVGQVQDITDRKRVAEANAQYTERLRLLHQIDSALIAGEGPGAIAAAALAPLRELLGVPRAIVNLFDLQNGEVEWLAAAGRIRVRVGPGVRYSIRLMGDVEALRRGELQLIDVHTLPPGPEVDALLASGIHAYVVVPMIARGELIGALSFGGGSAPLSAEQIGIAQEAAVLFAIALAHAQLHEQVKQQARELENRLAEQATAENALRESEERLRQIAENMREVVWMTDAEFSKTVYLSRAYEQVWGRAWQSAFHDPRALLDAVHPEDREKVIAGLQQLKQTESTQMDFRIVHPDGAVRLLRSRGFSIKNKEGRVYRIAGITEDITEQHQLEEKFLQAQKMEAVGRLAGGIAHDFNNLLTVINGYSDIVLSELRSGDPLREFVEQVRQAGERAAGLTRRLLAFSRKQVIVLDIFDLNSLIGDMEKMLRRLIGEDIDLRVIPGRDLRWIKADSGQVEQLIMNLVVNARDAMPKGGHLTIETANVDLDQSYTNTHPLTKAGKYVLVAVSDTGCGMDKATQSHLFEPFFTTKGEKGTGLGLATVYGIVKQAGGHVEVYSEVGVGTTFKVYLPTEVQLAAASTLRPESSVKLRPNETILLVEDEQAVRILTRQILQQRGYEVLEAKSGGDALVVAERFTEPIHLMITDVVMPKMSGRELAERLAPLRPRMKVLYVSGYTDEAIVHHGVVDPGAAFLPKPFTADALTRKVREVLDHIAPGPGSAAEVI